jgi:hypothetical protein
LTTTRRVPALQRRPAFRATVRALAAMGGWVVPQRLVLPVQLTLQSNTRPVVFLLALTAGAAAIPAIGLSTFESWTSFTLSGEFRYLDNDALRAGVRSSHYEDRLSRVDRVRVWPMIDTFVQGGGYVPLFLPYFPFRDNPVLDRLCPGGASPGDAECVKRLWEVRLNGRVVPLDGFLATERADLRMLGLCGLVPLHDVAPGTQRLTVAWTPAADEADGPLDDRYGFARVEFGIPFLFAPGYELELDAETGRTPGAGLATPE